MAEERALTTRQEFTSEQLELIKRTIAPETTDDEFKLFIMQCKRTGLDPFSRQIYAVKRWSSREQKKVMTIQTAIDGYRVIADRTETYAPGREPTFTYNAEGDLEAATAYGWKLKAGRWFEVSATARYTEYVQKDSEGRPTHFWEDMGHNQLAKCAEALLIRKCCPQDTSGIYTDTEMEQAENLAVKVEKLKPTPKAVPPAPPAPQPSAEPEADEEIEDLLNYLDEKTIKAAWAGIRTLIAKENPDLSPAVYAELTKAIRDKLQDKLTMQDFKELAAAIRAWQPPAEAEPVVDPRD